MQKMSHLQAFLDKNMHYERRKKAMKTSANSITRGFHSFVSNFVTQSLRVLMYVHLSKLNLNDPPSVFTTKL